VSAFSLKETKQEHIRVLPPVHPANGLRRRQMDEDRLMGLMVIEKDIFRVQARGDPAEEG
jgi:hypothetical protein